MVFRMDCTHDRIMCAPLAGAFNIASAQRSYCYYYCCCLHFNFLFDSHDLLLLIRL